ncbi:MAG: Flp pilus assembly complex ATPase component TadA [Desulfobacterales bacterium]|nr:Flp pilus assembly complex ATPase component TadA [Desulfobacterales bacterium]
MINAKILVVDDDERSRTLVSYWLQKIGYIVETAESGLQTFKILADTNVLPDLILLDIMMPEMDGYEVCARLQESAKIAFIPVIFFTALESEKDKTKAFLSGGSDFLSKTASKDEFLKKIEQHLDISKRWKNLKSLKKNEISPNFSRFKIYLESSFKIDKQKLESIDFPNVYSLQIDAKELAQLMAEFSHRDYIDRFKLDDVELGELPRRFCEANLVLPLKNFKLKNYVISNPFDVELINLLEKQTKGQNFQILITEPSNIKNVFLNKENIEIIGQKDDTDQVINNENENDYGGDSIIISIVDSILRNSVLMHASDIHIEPKEKKYILRLRVDGDMIDFEDFALNKKIAIQIISRLKILGKMNISEKRKPQDGAFKRNIDGKSLKFRISSAPTYNGETIVIRIIDQTSKPLKLEELGMTEEQSKQVIEFAKMPNKMILIVGVTGSGKSTTVRSILEYASDDTRCMITVEDPVEGIIPQAVQLEVNEEADATWKSILRAVMRQDPDVISIGEIRDESSAEIGVEAASTGHLVISTLHASSAADAIRRLEDLKVSRTAISIALRSVIAQTLCKKLCSCKIIESVNEEEHHILSQYGGESVDKLAKPLGCAKCKFTGYKGRVGIYEVLYFNETISKMVRENLSIPEIRNFFKNNGGSLISDNALKKVKDFTCSLENVLGVLIGEKNFNFV